MMEWDDIRRWRRATRAQLLSQRLAVLRDDRSRIRSVALDHIGTQFPELRAACIGFYWPFKGEIDLRPLVRHFLALGAAAALPVVVEKQRPLEFWNWQPQMKLRRGIWNIPVPAERAPVRPSALLVPLLGFDAAGYRLGYGGGYYDRTLAELDPKPLTIGIGYELGRLETIHPQPHDIPLDAIVTEAGCVRHRYRGRPLGVARRSGEAFNETFPAGRAFDPSEDDDAGFASPPCFMHELDPAYLGYMSAEETLALLNALLEGACAASRRIAAMADQMAGAPDSTALQDIARDEARFCSILIRHIERLGGAPSLESGAFHDKPAAPETVCERVDLLNRGQARIVRKLRDALPKIADDALQQDLKEMLEAHERHIRLCAGLGAAPQ